MIRVLIGGLAVSALLAAPASGRDQDAAPVRNGFRLTDTSVPLDQILSGGPPRDGIPALTAPETLPAAESPWHTDETVLGVVRGGEARAYPIAILNWHELVNDTLGGDPILVSYCPLCGTGMVFDRRVGGKLRTFGVSGLLYQSDLLLYDRETESLWSQIASTAVTGPASGTRLRVLRSELTRWGDWKARHPQSTVLGLDTGYARDYTRSPYGDYSVSSRIYFPAPLNQQYHPKMPTLGVRLVDGPARAYPATEIVNAGGQIEDDLAGRRIAVSYDPEARVFDVEAPDDVEVIEAYWFAWSAFHPDATIFVAVDGHPSPQAETGEKP